MKAHKLSTNNSTRQQFVVPKSYQLMISFELWDTWATLDCCWKVWKPTFKRISAYWSKKKLLTANVYFCLSHNFRNFQSVLFNIKMSFAKTQELTRKQIFTNWLFQSYLWQLYIFCSSTLPVSGTFSNCWKFRSVIT